MVIAGIVVVLVLFAGVYFIGLPMISGSKGTGSILQQPTTPPIPTSTPFPNIVSRGTTEPPRTVDIPAASQTYEEKYTEMYNQVYSVDHAFVGGQKEIFTQNTPTPPLYIKFNITPKIDVGEKVDKIGQMVSTSYISPDSWFKVNVYDAGNGVLVEQQGFNKGFSVTTRQEFMVRARGNYRVEMSGNDVTAEVWILTGKS
jgi:hypothetical protein